VIFVDCLLLFFLWVVSTCLLICLVLLMDGFPSLVWFLFTGWFFFFTLISDIEYDSTLDFC